MRRRADLAFLTAAMLVAVGCSGATQSPAPASPPPEPKTLADLINAEHPKVSATAVEAAMNAAFAADPVGWGNPGRTLDIVERDFGYCVKGDPTMAGGDPYANRALDCYKVFSQFWMDYATTGVEADYAAALAVYNYGDNTFSHVARYGATPNDWGPIVTLLQESFGG